MVIFNSYVSLPEAKNSIFRHTDGWRRHGFQHGHRVTPWAPSDTMGTSQGFVKARLRNFTAGDRPGLQSQRGSDGDHSKKQGVPITKGHRNWM